MMGRARIRGERGFGASGLVVTKADGEEARWKLLLLASWANFAEQVYVTFAFGCGGTRIVPSPKATRQRLPGTRVNGDSKLMQPAKYV
jgi:hypothetical protein